MLEAAKSGDAIEWRKMGRRIWRPALVLWNGGAELWTIEDEYGLMHVVKMEQVRIPGTNPWRNWSFG